MRVTAQLKNNDGTVIESFDFETEDENRDAILETLNDLEDDYGPVEEEDEDEDE